ncbi:MULTISPECIES: polysaccharide lyase family 1 protein [unclassified Pseudarthrobacter]|uniref:pectate lyase family protein n=1 Tax=unclassified Pseudarthrobacter TaxID=2647000 RepID=UPI003641A6E3
MRIKRPLAIAATAAAAAFCLPAQATAAPPPPQSNPIAQTEQQPLERQVLADRDGWASSGAGTTGGSAAVPERVFDVRSRAEMVSALAANGAEPRIIRVHGDIRANTGPAGELSCVDYAAGTGFSLEQYLYDYDPARYGTEQQPAGEQENARRKAAANQAAVIRWDIPSNTTIVGATADSSITGAALRINRANNVIFRNLTVRDSADCFPAWDPTDGDHGNWNSEYDLLQVINGSTNVWVDHSHFTDAPNLDINQPSYFGRPYQVHDGAVDVTNGSDLVTLSYNRFSDHDKLLLIGSTDSTSRGDVGKLRVTIHHNSFENVGQRAPRVRYGQVDVYNNHFLTSATSPTPYTYTFGAGVESHIYAEANAFTLPQDIPASSLIRHFKGQAITAVDNTVNGKRVDLLAAYNSAAPADKQLVADGSWTPILRTKVHPAQAVPALLKNNVGPVFTAGGGN